MARNLENSTSENLNSQEMGPRRSTRLNMTISGTAPPPRGSTMATTAMATTVATHGEVLGAIPTARAVPSRAHGTKVTAQAMSLQAQREPNALPEPSPSLAPTCTTRQAAHSSGPACSRRAAHSPWPSLLPPSSLLLRPILLPPSSLLTWPTLLPWPFKQPKSAQDHLNHPNLPSSRGHSHHISSQIWHFPTQIPRMESTTLSLLKEAHCFQALPIQMANNTCLDKS